MPPSATSPASLGRLSTDAIAVYHQLTEHLDLLADNVAASSGLTRGRADLAVSSLVRSGLARVVRLDTGQLRIELGSIAAVQTNLDQGDATRLSPAAVRLLRARVALGQMLDEDEPLGPRVERVTDRHELERRLEQLGSRTRREIFSLHAGKPLPAEYVETHMRSDLQMLERGVGVYIVYPISFLQLDYLADYAAELERAGAHVRFADAMPHRLVVSDRIRAVVPIEMANAARGALFTTESVICRSLHHLAASIFRRSRPQSAIQQNDPGGPPSPLERRVLILMSSGVTDMVAAKQLGVTDRTFRRYVRTCSPGSVPAVASRPASRPSSVAGSDPPGRAGDCGRSGHLDDEEADETASDGEDEGRKDARTSTLLLAAEEPPTREESDAGADK